MSKTNVEVEVTVTRQAEMKGDSKLTRMWAERKRGGEIFIKSPTYKCYGTSGKNHTTRKEACMRTSDNIDVSGTYRHGTSGELRREALPTREVTEDGQHFSEGDMSCLQCV